jgi:hypothetical protein
MTTIKVGDFFKPYKFDLGFQLKNPKLIALHVNFQTKVEFELLLSLPRWI